MHIKLIAIDLDGTLIRNNKTISDYTTTVLQRCRQKGILIAVATARSEAAAKNILT